MTLGTFASYALTFGLGVVVGIVLLCFCFGAFGRGKEQGE
ncbi:hypothetical protein SAMN05880557_107269 [Pseudacidovorax sp. RU35E]|nr:hypothetical protein SAMN05880557_107269 [Pseudacidovorax sp. RU35E]